MEKVNLPGSARVNFARMEIMLLDASQQGQDIFGQILLGMGIKKLHRFASADDAEAFMKTGAAVDLILTDSQLAPGKRDGYQFVHWLRRSQLEPGAFTPVIMTSGYTSEKNVVRARDCGANIIVSKPISPQILLHRILWVASEKRCFVDTGTYVGPDRRFKNVGPPDGSVGRRSTDLTDPIKDAADPNMSQEELDGLLKPQKAVNV